MSLNRNPAQEAFINARILQAKRQILWAVTRSRPLYSGGKVLPATVTSFAELHDFCDANELGGLCDDGITAKAAEVFPATGAGEPVAWMDACNTVQNGVHKWLASGEMLEESRFLSRLLNGEQLDCLLDDSRSMEARDMVSDLEARVGSLSGFNAEAVARLRELLVLPQAVVVGGNWYALANGVLFSGPVRTDGTLDFDAGGEVDMDRIDNEARALAVRATNLLERA